MKTIVKTADNVSRFIVEDDVVINSTSINISVGNPVKYTVWDLNKDNITIYTDITDVPDDYKGGKYCFNGSAWTSNPSWSAPEEDDE